MVFTDIQELPTVRQAKTEFIQRIKELTGLDTDVEIVPIKIDNTDFAIATLQQLICNAWGLSWSNITSQCREVRGKNVVDARHSFCYIAKKLLSITDKDIGKVINRDRTTVINSVNNVMLSLKRLDNRSQFLSQMTNMVHERMEEYMKKKS